MADVFHGVLVDECHSKVALVVAWNVSVSGEVLFYYSHDRRDDFLQEHYIGFQSVEGVTNGECAGLDLFVVQTIDVPGHQLQGSGAARVSTPRFLRCIAGNVTFG